MFRSQNEQTVGEKETDKVQGLGEDEDDEEGQIIIVMEGNILLHSRIK